MVSPISICVCPVVPTQMTATATERDRHFQPDRNGRGLCAEYSMTKKIVLAVIALMMAGPAYSIDSSIARQLEKLAPDERREQRCDIEAMARIAKEQAGFRPDKVIAYTFSDPIEKDDLVKAPGAAFRSGGNWYRLTYKCETGERGLSVRSFRYKIGAKIPRSQWEHYYLYD